MDKGITWVRYFSWKIDQLWHCEELSKMSHKSRHEFVSWSSWKRLLENKEFRRNSYRRRLWKRLARKKYDRIQNIAKVMRAEAKKPAPMRQWAMK